MVAVNVEALSCQLESIITEIQSLHDTMGVLIDDVADLGSTVRAAMLEVRAIRAGLARMDARIRKLESKTP
jgi:pyrimidine operon attenuation protein/uracil phosphoribosyltransferase